MRKEKLFSDTGYGPVSEVKVSGGSKPRRDILDEQPSREGSGKETMDTMITLAHGSGGKKTSELIGGLFKKYFDNEFLTADDAAVLPAPQGRIAMSTDGFIVSPYEFPGGNAGKLSICGTVNDLACMGARPLYLTCAFVVEEGFPVAKLEKLAASMAETAKEAGVKIVAGDTKVAGKGQVDGVFITTTAVGEILPGAELSGAYAKPGDKIMSVREVALMAQVTPNTVQKSYEQLEQQGVIYSRRGAGWFVSENQEIAQDVREQYIRSKTEDYIKNMQILGLSGDEIEKYVKEFINE